MTFSLNNSCGSPKTYEMIMTVKVTVKIVDRDGHRFVDDLDSAKMAHRGTLHLPTLCLHLG